MDALYGVTQLKGEIVPGSYISKHFEFRTKATTHLLVRSSVEIFKWFPVICYCSEKVAWASRQLNLSLLPILSCVVTGFAISRSFKTTLVAKMGLRKCHKWRQGRPPPYLPHGVILYCNFSEEEVDIVSIIQCLDKVRLCGQTGTLIGDMSHSVKRILIKCSQRRVIN